MSNSADWGGNTVCFHAAPVVNCPLYGAINGWPRPVACRRHQPPMPWFVVTFLPPSDGYECSSDDIVRVLTDARGSTSFGVNTLRQ